MTFTESSSQERGAGCRAFLWPERSTFAILHVAAGTPDRVERAVRIATSALDGATRSASFAHDAPEVIGGVLREALDIDALISLVAVSLRDGHAHFCGVNGAVGFLVWEKNASRVVPSGMSSSTKIARSHVAPGDVIVLASSIAALNRSDKDMWRLVWDYRGGRLVEHIARDLVQGADDVVAAAIRVRT